MGCVVLHVERRDVYSSSAACPLLQQCHLAHALKYDDVEVEIAKSLERNLDRVVRPRPRPGSTTAVSVALRRRGNEVLMGPLEERGHPGTMNVPYQDSH